MYNVEELWNLILENTSGSDVKSEGCRIDFKNGKSIDEVMIENWIDEFEELDEKVDELRYQLYKDNKLTGSKFEKYNDRFAEITGSYEFGFRVLGGDTFTLRNYVLCKAKELEHAK